MGTIVTLGGPASSGRGYLSEPAATGPGVLVVHDYHGALPHVRAAADALAESGFVALAPDLYGGPASRSPVQAARLLEALDVGRARSMLAAAAAQLRAHPRVRPKRLGAIGFSIGGWLALLVATTGALDAVVAYYAALDADEREEIRCPVLLHLAEVDEWDPPDLPATFIAELRAGGAVALAHTWPGTRHAFANADVSTHDPAAAGAAWAESVDFLAQHLRRDSSATRGPTSADGHG